VELHIKQVSAPDYDLRLLLTKLEAYLAGLYLPEQQHGWKLDKLLQPSVKIFLAKQGSRAVGCGSIALFDDYAEVKRMFVIPQARRQGVGRAVLKRLEEEAREAGKTWLRLETGHAQEEAMRLYEAYGFHPRGSFGEYKDLSPLALATSRFYELKLR
jgi:putative acetyltransferase